MKYQIEEELWSASLDRMLWGRSILLLLNCLIYGIVANVTEQYTGDVRHVRSVLLDESGVLHTRRGVIHNSVGVIATGRHRPHHVKKREINTKVAGFSEAEKVAILRIHNILRAKEGSSNMRKMSWSSELEKLAQAYAEKCIFDHSSKAYRQNVGGFDYIGENLYAGTASFDPVSPIQMWWDETKFFDYNTLYCDPGQMCGHYTQVVWASSYALGCGVKYCPVLQKVSFGQGYNVVCHYGPGGNYANQRPYKKGPPCSECPDELRFCVGGLCALIPQIGSPASNVHGSTDFNLHYCLLMLSVYTYIYINGSS
ncbi:GLIPR1-like protein 1 [Bulinus truncatus]|nr:GLIPR1-like protein 1 [Bulinus truncatus]